MIQSVTGGSVVDTGEFFRLDRQFHELMWQAADQTVLAAIAAQLYDRMSGPQRRAALSLNATAFRAQAESHLRMLTALDVDDLAMAQDESADHIRAGRIVMPDD
jgi:DNA-binding GntR family transcriptional regulator